MVDTLKPDEVARFRRDGALWPIRVLAAEEMADHLRRLEAIESARAGRLPPSVNVKAHLVIPWLWDLVHEPRIVDPVRAVLGPDVLCWAAGFFAKGPEDPAHVPWHQDATYWGLSEPRALTAWLAFTPSTAANGCMRIAQGSHHTAVPHGSIDDRHNMLPKGEKVLVQVDEAEAVDVILRPGEMSLHDVLTVHGSEPNRSRERRVGLAIRYIGGDLTQVGARGTATLVAGRDHGTFDLEQAPEADFHPAAMARHAAILRRWMGNVFAPTAVTPDAEPIPG